MYEQACCEVIECDACQGSGCALCGGSGEEPPTPNEPPGEMAAQVAVETMIAEARVEALLRRFEGLVRTFEAKRSTPTKLVEPRRKPRYDAVYYHGVSAIFDSPETADPGGES